MASSKTATVNPHFLIAPESYACVEISTAYEPGKHVLSLPSVFDRVPEFFVVAENPTLPKAVAAPSFCIYAVNPAAREIEVFPQDWFNDGTLDYGYQWITCATRDPATRRLLVSGIRIGKFVLDETGSPNIGPFHCGGLVTQNSKTGEITRSGQYWAFAHYSKLIQRDALVIGSTGSLPGIEHAAFLNPDGKRVLVIGNQGSERKVACRADGKTLHVNLPQNSAVTLEWS